MDKNYSVLVVDDEATAFDVIEAHLFREGYELFYAPSGAEALERLDAVEPDVILLDVMMPQMDGLAVCHEIKTNAEWKHVPIIMVTALNSKEDLARSLETGADDFITKPLSGIELRARVRSMLRIKQQYDALNATLRLREDLSHAIVHDLRNPLTSILLCSNLLMQTGFEGKPQKMLEIIADSGRELNSMIDDLLMLAKMESGKMVLNPVAVDLNQLATLAVKQFQAIATHKEIELVSQPTPQQQWRLIDTNLFHRVLDNLIANAIKFSPPRSTIIVRVNSSEANPSSVAIRVIDSGTGISADRKQRIFNKYEIGELMNGISQIGLGLAFCKMVVEAHGGQIFVEDNQPKGSIFTVTL